MRRSANNACRFTLAFVLSAGVLASALIAGAAPRLAVPDSLKPNAALAPRYEPVTPTKLDEFTPDPNLKSVHFGFDRAVLRPSEARTVDRDARWLKAHAPH